MRSAFQKPGGRWWSRLVAAGVGIGLAGAPVMGNAAPAKTRAPAAKPGKAGAARPAGGGVAPTGKKVPASDSVDAKTSEKTATDKKANGPPSAAGDKLASDKVAVMPLEIGASVPAGRAALEEAVRRGVGVVTSAPVIVGAEVTSTLNSAGVRVACTESACFQAVGRALRARHLIVGAVDRKASDFVVEFKVIAASDGRLIDRQTNRCEASECSVAELTRLTVLELARGTLDVDAKVAAGGSSTLTPASSTIPAGAASVATVEPAPVPSTTMPADSSADLSASAEESSRLPPWLASWRRWYPPVAIGGGVVAGAIGGYLISIDGDDICTSDGACRDEWNGLWPGIATIGGGALLLASGVVVAVMGRDRTTSSKSEGVALVDVGLTPSGFLLGGRF